MVPTRRRLPGRRGTPTAWIITIPLLTVLGIPLAEAVIGVVVLRFLNFWLPTILDLNGLGRSGSLRRHPEEDNASAQGAPSTT